MTGEQVYQKPTNMTIIDQWILSRLSLMINEVNDSFSQRDFHQVVASMKQFLHYEFCDYYLVRSRLLNLSLLKKYNFNYFKYD